MSRDRVQFRTGRSVVTLDDPVWTVRPNGRRALHLELSLDQQAAGVLWLPGQPIEVGRVDVREQARIGTAVADAAAYAANRYLEGAPS